MKKTLISLGIIFGILSIGLGSFLIIRARASNISVDSPEAEVFKKVLVHFSKALYDAQRYGMVDEFDQVLIDRPNETNFDEKAKTKVSNVYGPEAASHTGLLSVYKAEYASIWNGKQKLQELSAKAKAENRKLTEAESKEIAKAANGTGLPGYSNSDTWKEPVFTIEKIELTGDHAVVRFKSGLEEVEAYLINIKDQWYIYKFKHIHSDL